MNRVAGLDLLRAVAILWIMLYHAAVLGLLDGDNPVVSYGWMGVDLFFALSGYLIGGQLLAPYARGEAGRPGLFYLRRAFRILPAYLVVVGVYFLWPAFSERPGLAPLWRFLTFTWNLDVDFRANKAFSHVWSLCVEEHFYLIAPFLVAALMRRPAAWKAVAVCAAILIGGMALRGAIWLLVLEPLKHLPQGGFGVGYQERIYYPTWTRLDGLLAGFMLAMVRVFRPAAWAAIGRRANLTLAGALAGLGLSVWLFVNQRDLGPTVFAYPILAFSMAGLVAAAAAPRGALARLRVPGASSVAAIAYSLYLVHKPVMHLTHLYLGARLETQPLLAAVAFPALAIAAGALLYLGVERPFLRLRDRLLAPPRRPLPARAQALG